MKYYNIPIFVPHKGCPFDCVFCNQKHITGTNNEVDEEYIKKTVEEYLKTLPRNDSIIEIAFFGGSFTGIDPCIQRRFLSTAHEYVKNGMIDGIRISTRPDYIDETILKQLSEFGVTTIELGVQSLDDGVLKKSNRGHTADDVEKAVKLIRKYPFKLGLQMMTGLPGDTDARSLKTADGIIGLKPEFVRIYPTLVVKDTYLEIMYNRGEYTPQTVPEAVNLCKQLLVKFENAKITVIRIALQTTEEISPGGSLVAGPFDSRFRERVESAVYYDKLYGVLQNKCIKNTVVTVNSREISKAIGAGRENIMRIKNTLGIDLKIKASDSVEKGECLFENDF